MLNLTSEPPGFNNLSDERPHAWGMWAAVATPIILIAFWIVAGYLQPQAEAYNPLQQTISVLAGYGAAHRWLMTLGLYLVAIGYLITAAGLRAVHQSGRMLLFVASLAGFGVALNPQPPSGTTFDHMAFAVTGAVLLLVWPFVMALTRPSTPLRGNDARAGAWERLLGRQGCFVMGAVIAVSVLALFICAQLGDYLGLAERICTALQTLPPLLFALGLRRTIPARNVRAAVLETDPLHDGR